MAAMQAADACLHKLLIKAAVLDVKQMGTSAVGEGDAGSRRRRPYLLALLHDAVALQRPFTDTTAREELQYLSQVSENAMERADNAFISNDLEICHRTVCTLVSTI